MGAKWKCKFKSDSMEILWQIDGVTMIDEGSFGGTIYHIEASQQHNV